MKNILFFGGGNIAQALISGLLLDGMSNKNIFFVDRNPLNQKKLNSLKVKSLKKSIFPCRKLAIENKLLVGNLPPAFFRCIMECLNGV